MPRRISLWLQVSFTCSLLMTGCQQSVSVIDEQKSAANQETPAAQPTASEESDPAEPGTADVQNGSDSNTAGGIGQARVKEKTLTEELVPEEARELTQQAMERIPPILRGLRESGRLNWKMGELENDVLDLNWKQEQFVLDLRSELIEYLKSVQDVYEAVWDRMKAGSAGINGLVYERIERGDFVHPELRKAVSEKEFLKTPTAPNGFLQAALLHGLQERFEHPLHKIKEKVVNKDLRRSDLFYMLAAYRIATNDYARILSEEGDFDHRMGIAEFSDLCAGNDVDYIEVSYQRANGFEVKQKTRGHLYLPRLHQEGFTSAHGPKPKEDLTYRERMLEELERRQNGGQSGDSGNLTDQLFRKPTESSPVKNFLTTVESPKDRDTLKRQRTLLDKRISTLVELLGAEWAEFDFSTAVIGGEDTYFTERILMEETTDRRNEPIFNAFRGLMEKLTTAETLEQKQEIADEFLPPSQANELAEFLVATSPESFRGSYSGTLDEFRSENLPEQLRPIYKAVIAAEENDFYSKPLAEDLVRAVQLISEGEHLAAKDQKSEAVEKFKEAVKTTPLSSVRRKHFAAYCMKHGFDADARVFWTENESQQESNR